MSAVPGVVHLAVTEFVARVTVANPARRNAMSLSMWQALGGHFGAISERRDVRVVVLRGEADRAFVSGADISEFDSHRSSPADVRIYDTAIETALTAIVACPVPVIACIHGACMGGGVGLALSCDLRYAASDARFCMPAAKLGLGYSPRNLRRIVHVIGAARAGEMFFTARTYDGVEAGAVGLVHAVHAGKALDSAVEEITATIARNAPLTIRAAKLAIRAAIASPDEALSGAAADAVRACVDSDDYVEGRRAFGEKRAPRFQGR